ncbi:hypothetical protein [Streptomyces sp. UG1]|uniref:hypothetical protein n=1 Tax=Streptomyces sp. UG1 TaxID=3417652 RepID=UPI003CF996F1
MGATALLAILLGCSTHETNNNCTDSAQCGDGNGRNEEAKAVSELELAKATAEIRPGIPATETDGTYEVSPAPVKIEGGVLGIHIDLTVKNLGTKPAFISKATMTFRKSGYPEGCVGIGGPLLTTATYNFTIPDDQPYEDGGPQLLHKTPFSISRELTHEIPPNKYEKFTLTVGPESDVKVNPWFGVLDVILERDDGKKLEIGPLAVIASGSNPAFYPDGDSWSIDEEKSYPECLKRNAAMVREIMRTPKITVSKEFASLDKALSKYL